MSTAGTTPPIIEGWRAETRGLTGACECSAGLELPPDVVVLLRPESADRAGRCGAGCTSQRGTILVLLLTRPGQGPRRLFDSYSPLQNDVSRSGLVTLAFPAPRRYLPTPLAAPLKKVVFVVDPFRARFELWDRGSDARVEVGVGDRAVDTRAPKRRDPSPQQNTPNYSNNNANSLSTDACEPDFNHGRSHPDFRGILQYVVGDFFGNKISPIDVKFTPETARDLYPTRIRLALTSIDQSTNPPLGWKWSFAKRTIYPLIQNLCPRCKPRFHGIQRGSLADVVQGPAVSGLSPAKRRTDGARNTLLAFVWTFRLKSDSPTSKLSHLRSKFTPSDSVGQDLAPIKAPGFQWADLNLERTNLRFGRLTVPATICLVHPYGGVGFEPLHRV
ncbi:hypothetical protein FB451DRAFT_1176858 [Mycena latifolia]|nr:hypothetical protein FB451DRAFT_1176858 [Mycena latifolia]